jgi:hypothetical protein
MRMRSISTLVLAMAAAEGCAPLPRISTSTTCDASTTASLIVQSVDAVGKNVAFAPVAVRSSHRSSGLMTETSSAGRLALTLQPGSYSVAVGDDSGDWQQARVPVRLRAGCVVTARARLIKHEIDPNPRRLDDRVRRVRRP